MPIVRTYDAALTGVRAARPEVKLEVRAEPTLGGELVLQVSYPEANDDPAGRDVWTDAVERNWSSGRALSFRVQSQEAMRLSVSFFDRNRVVYTTWVDVAAGGFQSVRIAFAEMRPNPYFQPPEAKTGAPLDVSEVPGIAFAPQVPHAGRFAITRFTIAD